jgi:hypothetical protein
MDLGGSRTLIPCVQDRRLTIRRQAQFFSVARRDRTFILGLRRAVLIRLSYRNFMAISRSGPGRIRTCNEPFLRRPPLPDWATGPFCFSTLMHRAGFEPASLRLKIGGSPFKLPVRCGNTIAMHREGFEPPADSLEESCSSDRAAGAYRFEHRFLLQSMTDSYSTSAPGRTRTCISPLKKRGLCQLSDECICSKCNYLSRKCTGQDSNLHPSAS